MPRWASYSKVSNPLSKQDYFNSGSTIYAGKPLPLTIGDMHTESWETCHMLSKIIPMLSTVFVSWGQI